MPGDSVQTMVVDLKDDTLAEGLEHFNLTLSKAVNATLVDSRGVAVIGASDAKAVAGPTISVADRVVGESEGYIDVVVSLSVPGTQAVSVNYATASVTTDSVNNANGFDYSNVAGILNFAAGETTKTVRIELSQSQGIEGLEHFRFNLNTPTNATIAKASAMVGIVDNDTIALSPSLPSLFVRDVLVDEKAGTASFVVMLGGPAGQASNSIVTVDYATGGGNATAGSDYVASSGRLSFAPGESVKTVVVDLKDDTLTEGLERFNLTLSRAVNATLVDGSGVAVIGASEAATVLGPSISVADQIVSEGDGYLDVVVRLSAPSAQAVRVNYATASVTTDSVNNFNGFDYSSVAGTLNFAAGETTQVVRIELSQTQGAESPETFRFNLSSPVNAILANPFATVTIVDNDIASIHVLSHGISDDSYTVTASTDVIVENPGGGSDLVRSSVDYSLGSQVEHLTLIGTSGLAGTGNALNNRINGNPGANTLSGLAGNDTLTGGTGADTFVVSSLVGSDRVTDFNSAADTFRFSQSGVRVGNGDLVVDNAVTRAAAGDFSANAELVIFSADIAGAITNASTAAAIGSATAAYAIGDARLFVVDNGTQSGIYLFKAANADAVVSATELTQLVLVAHDGDNALTALSDYTFAA